MFLRVSVCLSVCSQKITTGHIFMKFSRMAGHNSGTNRLDPGGNPDLDADPGMF